MRTRRADAALDVPSTIDPTNGSATPAETPRWKASSLTSATIFERSIAAPGIRRRIFRNGITSPTSGTTRVLLPIGPVFALHPA